MSKDEEGNTKMTMEFKTENKTIESNGWKYEYVEYDVVVDGKSTGSEYVMGGIVSDEDEDDIDNLITDLRKINKAVFPCDIEEHTIVHLMKTMGIKPTNY